LGSALAHPTAAWTELPSYWQLYQYVPVGRPVTEAVYNSCALPGLAPELQCSGNGECKAWRPDLVMSAWGRKTSFCQCNRDWADPECRTRRKSQRVAYFLSVFVGYLGIDHFYMGLYYSGFAKLATLGLGGAWWIFDVVRIGSAPVYASEYRLAYDLPHWFYVMFTVAFFTAVGYFLFGFVAVAYKREKAMSRLLMQEDEHLHKMRSATHPINPSDTVGMPTFASYPLPLPPQHPNGGYGAIPPSVKKLGQMNPFSPYAVWQHALQGWRPCNKYNSHMQPADPYEHERMCNPPVPMSHPGAYYPPPVHGWQ